MSEFKTKVTESLARIEVRLEQNTKILDEHHKRSTQLEERIKPLEDNQIFFNKLSKVIMGIAGAIAALMSAYNYLFPK